jgi:PBP1b-binding outer membrane lipoprotein LpoB
MKKILAPVGLLIALVIMGCSKENSPCSNESDSQDQLRIANA